MSFLNLVGFVLTMTAVLLVAGWWSYKAWADISLYRLSKWFGIPRADFLREKDRTARLEMVKAEVAQRYFRLTQRVVMFLASMQRADEMPFVPEPSIGACRVLELVLQDRRITATAAGYCDQCLDLQEEAAILRMALERLQWIEARLPRTA